VVEIVRLADNCVLPVSRMVTINHLTTHLIHPARLASQISKGAFDMVDILESRDIPRVLVSLTLLATSVDSIDEVWVIAV